MSNVSDEEKSFITSTPGRRVCPVCHSPLAAAQPAQDSAAAARLAAGVAAEAGGGVYASGVDDDVDAFAADRGRWRAWRTTPASPKLKSYSFQ